ncbi:hypothetical protein V7166_17825 [Bacillus thuringiensis]
MKIELVDGKFIITGDEDVLQMAEREYHKHDLWDYDVSRVELLTLIELIRAYEMAKKTQYTSAAESYMREKEIFLIGLNQLNGNFYPRNIRKP